MLQMKFYGQTAYWTRKNRPWQSICSPTKYAERKN